MMRKNSSSKGSGIPVSVLKPHNQSETPINRMSVLKPKAGESNQKKLQGHKRNRSSVDKLNRVSLVQVKTTPKTPNLFTPSQNQNKHLAVNMPQYSRCSIDTMRSSVGTKSGKSSWPLNDPSFKSSQIDAVLEFLTNHDCPFNVNRQMLRSPSRKDFSEIFHFIYRYINPKLTMSQRFEDDIPKILKALKILKYPVQLPKSSFLNVGSPHVWPSILAMLGWLIDLINMQGSFEESELFFSKDFDEGVDWGEMKIRSLVSFFRSDDDDATPHIESYKEYFEKEENIEDSKLEELNMMVEDLVRKYESMSSEKEEVKIAVQHYEELCNDKEKILKFNEDMKVHLHARDKERSHLATILEDLQEEKVQLSNQIKMLEEKKSLQSFSAAEMNMFKNFRNEMAIQVNYLDIEKKNLNEQIWNAEVSIGKCRTKISELVIQYTSLCDKLQLSNCRISMSDLETNLSRWKEEILPAIQCEISREKREAFEISNELMHIAQEKGKIEESVHTLECEKRKLECKVKRLQDESKHIRTEKADEEAILNADVEILKDEISRLRLVTAPPVHELEKQLEEQTKENEKWKQKRQDIKEEFKKEANRTMDLCMYAFRERDKMVSEFNSNAQAMISQSLQNAKATLQAIDDDEEK